MAWIESHQELGRHPKTKRFARLACISIPAAVGHLQFLWWWALDFAQDGDLSGYDADDIADAMCWEGDAQSLIDSLCVAGFLDRDQDSVTIHNWYKYAGKLLEKRASDRKRKQVKKVSVGIPAEIQRNGDGSRKESQVTVPNLTVPNRTDTTGSGTGAGAREDDRGLVGSGAYIEQNLLSLSPGNWDELRGFIQDDQVPEDLVIFAVDEAVAEGKRTFSYLRSILNRYVCEGIKTLDQAKAEKRERQDAAVRRRSGGRAGPAEKEYHGDSFVT